MRDIFDQIADDIAKGPVDAVQAAREHSKRNLPKRFYERVSVTAKDSEFAVLLDGRMIKTPARNELVFKDEGIAEGIAAEWELQEEEIDPGTMPLTRIAHSAIDAVEDKFNEVADEITRYAGNDYLCYRADAPAELVKRQKEQWDCILEWAEQLLGGRLKLAEGIMHVTQDDVVIAAYRRQLDRYHALQLAAIHTVTSICGSALLALALAEKAYDAETVWSAAHVDEDWNIELWGQDDEAARVRRFKSDEFAAAVLILIGAPEET
ncbi:ATP12 chaperone protein [Pseudovibrio axinellae]|uniref:ATP12 chaperone protein n=1 Tax=Pseudovibrio axinellae TaxID=989403 RepID=A0A166AIJ0_9HYPH|nr:ATP12 family protein [Pseudovibrio axinellae]KZL21160.1 ATP12 chaperone protein [Pseudovibrio axinellae]SEQ89793.1 Chaperone required for the assembly of the F1-ATPase [Pseudovibrio axinellae]